MTTSAAHTEHPATYLVWLQGRVDREAFLRALNKPSRHLPVRRPWLLLLDLRGVTAVDPEAADVLRLWLPTQGPALCAVGAIVDQELQRELVPPRFRPPVRAFENEASARAWFAAISRTDMTATRR